MAIANSYPVGTPKASDLLLGTSVPTPGTDEKATTKNFSVSQVAAIGYKEVTRTLTNAEFIALPTTSIALVPSQGAGAAIKVLEATLKFNFVSTSFFFPGGITIGSGAVATDSNAKQCFLPGDSGSGGFDDIDGNEVVSLATKNATTSFNGPLYIGCPSGTNAGNGTVDVIVRYQVIN